MRRSLLPGLALASLALAWAQGTIPAAIGGHVQALQDAGSMTATVTVQPTGGAPEEWKFSFSKPNLYRIERESGFVVSDGKSVTTYDKSTNTFTEEPRSAGALDKRTAADELWAWGAFFGKEAVTGLRSAQAGAKRNLKGNQVTEVAIVLEGGSATMYIDAKLGIARGFSLKRASTDILVLAKEIAVSKDAIPSTVFQFAAPSGATKAVAPAKPAATYSAVQAIFGRNCMPCHGKQGPASGLDLTTHSGLMAKPGVVVPGDPSSSRLIQAIRGASPRMPQGRAPLTAQDVELISTWIGDGATGS